MSDHYSQDVRTSQLAQDFIVDFVHKKDDLANKVATLGSCNDFRDQINLLSTEIQKLSKSLHNATAFLPSYSIKKRQEDIRLLEKLLKDKEDILIPKRKFGFKSKIPNGALKEAKIISAEKPIDSIGNGKISVDSVKLDSNFVTVEDIRNKSIVYEETALNGADVLVRNLQEATVQLRGTPASLRISGLKDCSLVCGPVYTSIFVEDCTNCKLYLCCQQLRTHSSRKVDIYLKVRARAIIEDCSEIRFAPYSYPHNKLSEWYQRVAFDPELERFDCVDDFNWLSDSPSPNWSILPNNEREDFPM